MQAIAKRQRVPIPTSDASPTDFDLIAALLPHSTSAALNEEDQDYEDERRTATLLLLRLAYAQAQAQLTNIAEEFELLRTAPPPPPPGQPGTSSDRARTSPGAERATWTLDAPLHSAAAARRGGPLLDSAGKVCDPIRLLSLSLRDSRLYERMCSRCSRLRYYPLALEVTVRGCENRCSSPTIACPRCPSTSI